MHPTRFLLILALIVFGWFSYIVYGLYRAPAVKYEVAEFNGFPEMQNLMKRMAAEQNRENAFRTEIEAILGAEYSSSQLRELFDAFEFECLDMEHASFQCAGVARVVAYLKEPTGIWYEWKVTSGALYSIYVDWVGEDAAVIDLDVVIDSRSMTASEINDAVSAVMHRNEVEA